MSDPSKVFVFGSFSEDEARSLLNPTPASAKKTDDKKQPQVNTPNHEPVLMFGNFNKISESDPQVGYPNPPVDAHPSAIHKNPIENSATKLVHSLPENGNFHPSAIQKNLIENPATRLVHSLPENGNAHDSNHCHPKNQEIVSENNRFALHLSNDNDISMNDTNNVHLKESRGKTNVPIPDSRSMLPRGLINSGNLCFLNATLQALLACSPFVQLLQRLRNLNIEKVRHPTLVAFVEFVREFDAVGGPNPKKKYSECESGMPFSPTMFDAVLKKFTPDVFSSISRRSRQEDAQEFLSFIMDQMHDELLKFEGQSHSNGIIKSSLVSTSEDDGWETVGPKNKSAVTRKHTFAPSELSSIFGGELQSVVKSRGNTPSATVEPFFLLHLDISYEVIRTIEDALHFFTAPEKLDEYRPSTAGKVGVVAARKSVNIQSLPKILILHLKRFGYGTHGSTKVHKPVRFPLELVLSRDLLVSSTVEGRRYELVSTVTHHGREDSRGHYTADIRSPSGQWLRFDDASVSAISTNKVLHGQAYLLFYKQT